MVQYEITSNLAGTKLVKYACPNCNTLLKNPLREAGNYHSCAHCKTNFQIPGAKEKQSEQLESQRQTQLAANRESESRTASRQGGGAATEHVSVRCECGANVKAPSHLIGKSAKCPRCENTLFIEPQDHVTEISKTSSLARDSLRKAEPPPIAKPLPISVQAAPPEFPPQYQQPQYQQPQYQQPQYQQPQYQHPQYQQPLYPQPQYQQQPQVVVHNHMPATLGPQRVVAVLLWLFLGGCGAHRFYTGDTAIGVLFVCSMILCGVTLGLWLPIHFILVLVDGIIMICTKQFQH